MSPQADINEDVSIVVLTHNRKDCVLDCIRSIMALRHSKYEVIVVDNGSTDRTSEEIAHLFPTVKVVRSEINLGAAKGRNIGCQHAKYRLIMFVDDDVVLDQDVLNYLVTGMQYYPNVGVVAPKSFEYNNPSRLVSNGCDINRISGRIRGELLRNAKGGLVKPFFEVHTVSSACILVRKDVYEMVGGFDELFNIVYDDVDFCLRVKEAGFRVLVASKAKIWHKSFLPTDLPFLRMLGIRSPRRVYHIMRNKALIIERYSNAIQLVIFLLVFHPFYCLFHSFVAMRYRKIDMLRNVLSGFLSGLLLIRRARSGRPTPLTP